MLTCQLARYEGRVTKSYSREKFGQLDTRAQEAGIGSQILALRIGEPVDVLGLLRRRVAGVEDAELDGGDGGVGGGGRGWGVEIGGGEFDVDGADFVRTGVRREGGRGVEVREKRRHVTAFRPRNSPVDQKLMAVCQRTRKCVVGQREE